MSVLKPPRRKNLPQADRRETLLEAALTCFGQEGYHGTHVAHIVQRAGVARGTFYLHFESKHAVFECLIERMLGIFLDARPEGFEENLKDEKGAEALLRASYGAILTTFRQHRRLLRLLLEEAIGLEKGFAVRLRSHFTLWHQRVAATLTFLREQGIARRDVDIEISAELVLGMVERLARRYLLPDPEPDLPRLIDALVRLELNGVCPASRPPTARA